jgi:NAD(P)-dependent dehydrogenase (short-subunit alcohol dehydrogenase family)
MPSPSVTVVTGAGTGLGKACAIALLQNGIVVLVDRDKAGLELTRQEIVERRGSDLGVYAFPCDVAAPEEVGQLFNFVDELGRIGSLVHAAGVSMAMTDWATIFRVNLYGTALILRAAQDRLEPGAAAVCFSSMASYTPGLDSAEIDAVIDEPLAPDLIDKLAVIGAGRVDEPTKAYAWSKRGVRRLVVRTAAAWGPTGRITSVSPGIIDTPMYQAELKRMPAMADIINWMPLHRLGEPAEVADVVKFLVSRDARYLTACDIPIDGGAIGLMQLNTN